jgi:anti-sigma B factor antagonist
MNGSLFIGDQLAQHGNNEFVQRYWEEDLMRLSSREIGDVTVLEPKGKIMGGPDATAMHEMLHDLVAHEKKRVIIDLGGVDWMNSTGLGILISSLTTMRNNNGDLKLANITEKIQSLLTITKLVTVFETFDSVQEAVSSFSEN